MCNGSTKAIENDKKMVLFMNQYDCCGCAVCANSCPHHAIEMKPDDNGFLYPAIDSAKCVGCGLCKTVCAFGKENDLPSPMGAFAVQAKADGLLEKSASGGVFAVLAKEVLAKGGAVVGCALERIDGRFGPHHIVIDSEEELSKLQGSKYVQSNMGDIYYKVGNLLKSGQQVLFSGTPCQVDGLRHFLRGKSYPNLLTVDLICHGVPGTKMFADYIGVLEKKYKSTAVRFSFRDKSSGWGYNSNVKMQYKDYRGHMQETVIPGRNSSFYKLFQRSEICRESCYGCKYACIKRPGDLTVGDFWGIEKQHPRALTENGGDLQLSKGISCLLVNTTKGNEWMDVLCGQTNMVVSHLDAVSAKNMQLLHPTARGKNREKIFTLYRKSGYGAVERWYAGCEFRRRCGRKLKKLFSRLR